MMIDPQQITDGELTEEEQIYKENILDHYKNPHNFGNTEHAHIHHRELNPLCGDEIELFLQIKEGTCTKASFIGKGCAISQASVSMLTDKLKGMTLDDIKKINRQNILEMLGIPVGVVRMKCALLSLKTLQKGVQEWQAKN